MTGYQLTSASNVVRLQDGAIIPADPENRDYADALEWLAGEGLESFPEAPPEPPVVPDRVSAFQARAALADAGLLDMVEGMMADPATPVKARLAWQHATEFLRTSPTVLGMGAALGLDETALDAMFIHAATIVA